MKDRYIVYHLLLVLLLFVIIFVRAPEVLMLPSLRVEDGAEVFAYFYQNRDLSQLVRFKAGYIPLIANVIGFISVRFPTRMTPYVLAWVPLFIALITYAIFFHRCYTEYIPSDKLRFSVCVLFVFALVNKRHFIALTDYSIWNTLLLLIFLSLLKFPDRHRVPFLLAYCILTWSHPLTILTLPASFLLLIKDKQNRFYYVVIILNHLLHQILGVEMPSGTSAFSLDLFQVVVPTLDYLVDVSFITFFGLEALEFIILNAAFLRYIWMVAFLSGTVVVCRVNKGFRRLSLSLGYYVVSITFLTALTRGVGVLESADGPPRYMYAQSLLLLVIGSVVFVHSLAWAIEKVQCRFAINKLFPVQAESIAIGLLAGYYIILSVSNSAPYHHRHPENGYIVRDFFLVLAEEEDRLGSYEGIYLRADKIDDWDITIDTRETPVIDRVVYHDGYYHDGVGRYEEGVFPWMDLLAKVEDTWYGPERNSGDGIDAQPLPDEFHWECTGGFDCHPNGEVWWTESSNEGTARLIGPAGEIMIEVPLCVTFQGSGGE